MKFEIQRINEGNYPLFDDMVFWRENGYEREPQQIAVTETAVERAGIVTIHVASWSIG